jgi:hypothetical protein
MVSKGAKNRLEAAEESQFHAILDNTFRYKRLTCMLCLKYEDAFVKTCVANLMEVKVLCVQQDLRYGISSYWRFNV